jgi:hypothetical protein
MSDATHQSGRDRDGAMDRCDCIAAPANRRRTRRDTDMLSPVQSGAIESFALSGLTLTGLVPATSINGVGSAFRNHAVV